MTVQTQLLLKLLFNGYEQVMTIILVYVRVPCTLLKHAYSLAIFAAPPTAGTSGASALTTRAATIFYKR